MLWFGLESVWMRWENPCEKPVMTFLKKNSINTERFIDRMAAIYTGDTQIWAVANEGYQRFGTSWLEEQVYLVKKRFIFS